MNRRGFLKLFAGAAAGAVVVPKVSYFFAPKAGWPYPFATGGWAPNSYRSTPGELTMAKLQRVMNEVFCRYAVLPASVAIGPEMHKGLIRTFGIPHPIISCVPEIYGVRIVSDPRVKEGAIIPIVPPKLRHYFPDGFPIGV